MKTPVEHIKVSQKGRDILLKLKKKTGIEHWNELCRIALCYSLSIDTPLSVCKKTTDSSIDIEWKVFAGPYHSVLAGLIIYVARRDDIDVDKKDVLASYVRSHIERGIVSLQNIKRLSDIYNISHSVQSGQHVTNSSL